MMKKKKDRLELPQRYMQYVNSSSSNISQLLQTWEELEREAVAADKAKRRNEEQDEAYERPKKKRR